MCIRDRGWLRLDPNTGAARLRVEGAIAGVWRQDWPLASLHLRAADRYARRLLAEHDLDVEAFTGAAPDILVARQSLPAQTLIGTVRAGYEHVRLLAQHIDPQAALESVVVELDRDAAGMAQMLEFRYTFLGYADHSRRRIRRAVSYTHLDVYKRQQFNSSTAPIASIRKQSLLTRSPLPSPVVPSSPVRV